MQACFRSGLNDVPVEHPPCRLYAFWTLVCSGSMEISLFQVRFTTRGLRQGSGMALSKNEAPPKITQLMIIFLIFQSQKLGVNPQLLSIFQIHPGILGAWSIPASWKNVVPSLKIPGWGSSKHWTPGSGILGVWAAKFHVPRWVLNQHESSHKYGGV